MQYTVLFCALAHSLCMPCSFLFIYPLFFFLLHRVLLHSFSHYTVHTISTRSNHRSLALRLSLRKIYVNVFTINLGGPLKSSRNEKYIPQYNLVLWQKPSAHINTQSTVRCLFLLVGSLFFTVAVVANCCWVRACWCVWLDMPSAELLRIRVFIEFFALFVFYYCC